MSAEKEAVIRAALEQAVRAGHEVLTSDGTALNATIAAIRILEDSPEFNAGRGAELTNTGTVEMDASIMDGKTLQAGDRKSTRLNSSHVAISYAVFGLKKKK